MMPRFPLLGQAFLGLIFIKMTLTLMTSDCFCPHMQFYNNVLLFASHEKIQETLLKAYICPHCRSFLILISEFFL